MGSGCLERGRKLKRKAIRGAFLWVLDIKGLAKSMEILEIEIEKQRIIV
jgi:hypothetical protein